jgi:hypothetical protein
MMRIPYAFDTNPMHSHCLLCSSAWRLNSPVVDSGPGGASPRHISQRLSHLSTGRNYHRVTLSASAVTAWLGAHPAAASGISTVSLDLKDHLGAHDFDTASFDRLLHKLPRVTRVMMAGAVDGTDAYEPIGEVARCAVNASSYCCARTFTLLIKHSFAASCCAGRQLQPLLPRQSYTSCINANCDAPPLTCCAHIVSSLQRACAILKAWSSRQPARRVWMVACWRCASCHSFTA